MLAGAMVQSLMLAGNSGGIALAIDIEMGFTDRLFAAPISRFAVVLGRLPATAALGRSGRDLVHRDRPDLRRQIAGGVPGSAAGRSLVVAGAALAFGGIGSAIALRTGKASVVQGLFPLVFVILFLSNAFFPANLMLEPAGTVAALQPAELHRRRDPRADHLRALDGTEGSKRDRADRHRAVLGFALSAARAARPAADGRLRRGARTWRRSAP